MTNKFAIVIGATDKFSATFDRLNQKARGITGTLDRGMRSQRDWGQQFGRTLGSLSSGTVRLAENLGALDAKTAGIFTMGRAGGLIGLAAGAGFAVAKLSLNWAEAGHAASLAGKAIGISAQDVLTWEEAGKRAGLGAGVMTDALQGLAAFLHSSVWDPEANDKRELLQRLGITVGTKNGIVDVTRAMHDFARAFGRIGNPQTAERIASMTGLGAALPFLRQGDGAVQGQLNKARAAGIPGAGDVSEADRFKRAADATAGTLRSKANAVGAKTLPVFTRMLENLDSVFSGKASLTGSNALGGGIDPAWKSSLDFMFNGDLLRHGMDAMGLYPPGKGPRANPRATSGSLNLQDPATEAMVREELNSRSVSVTPRARELLDIQLTINGAPPGMTASASAGGKRVPLRIEQRLPGAQ